MILGCQGKMFFCSSSIKISFDPYLCMFPIFLGERKSRNEPDILLITGSMIFW